MVRSEKLKRTQKSWLLGVFAEVLDNVLITSLTVLHVLHAEQQYCTLLSQSQHRSFRICF
jgi:hypothetical protein